MCRTNALCSSPAPLVLEGPPCLPLPISPASLLCPQDLRSPEGTIEGIRPSPRAERTSLANWAGDVLAMLPPIPEPKGVQRSGNPSPLSATPQGCWSCPVSTSPPPSVPPHPTSSVGGSSCHLGRQGPPPESCRFSSCEETPIITFYIILLCFFSF